MTRTPRSPTGRGFLFPFPPRHPGQQDVGVSTGQGVTTHPVAPQYGKVQMEKTMRAVNPAKYIGAPRGYPRQAALAPDAPSMPTVRPANYDPGARLLPDIPAAWKLTEDAYKSTVAQLEALMPIAHLFKDQIASLK